MPAARKPGQPYTPREAAEQLRVGLETIYDACRRGELGHARFGAGRGTIRIEEADLAAFKEAARSRPTTDEVGLKFIKPRRA
jgi:excisionase family DNA binding protein